LELFPKYNMKVIFLDIDGVVCLNGVNINSILLDRIKKITLATDSKVVISSSWRNCKKSMIRICSILKDNDIGMAGETLDLPLADNIWEDRVEEILEWVDRKAPCNWVAIDDLPLHQLYKETNLEIRSNILPHFVECDIFEGIQDYHVNYCIEFLGIK